MNHIYVAHDFNLNIYLYKLPNISVIKKYLKNKKIKLIDINKINKNERKKITIFWGNRINENIIKDLENLKWVHFASSGINKSLLNILKGRKILITNSRGLFNKSMTNLIFNFIFQICTGTHFINWKENNKRFNRNYFNNFFDFNESIDNKKILILGYGEISKFLVSKLKHFNNKISIVVYKRAKKKINGISKIYTINQIDKAFEKNNMVINLFSENINTFEIINIRLLKKLPKYSSLINVSRGDIVKNVDLIRFLNLNKTFIYASDVFSRKEYVNPYKPLDYKSKLLKLNRVIISPHIGAVSKEFWNMQLELFSKNLKLFYNKNNKIIMSNKI